MVRHTSTAQAQEEFTIESFTSSEGSPRAGRSRAPWSKAPMPAERDASCRSQGTPDNVARLANEGDRAAADDVCEPP